MEPDPDDIIRVINLESANECAAKIKRLIRSRKGYKAAYTEYFNICERLMNASLSDDGTKYNNTKENLVKLERAFEKLEIRYEKFQKLNMRILAINHVEKDTDSYQKVVDKTTESYMQHIDTLGQLRIHMLPDPTMPQNAAGNGGGQNLRTVDALKPSFQLSFDNSPTELSTWLSLFRSFFEASRLHILPNDQQQAFLRQGLSPEVWTVIKGKLNLEMSIFRNPAHPHEDSCESIIEEAFQVRYPLIMRRFNFFKYERKGSQTYSDFHAKLQELATAANLENLDMNDYFLYKLIVGLNDPKTIDRILSIPSQDFNLEEVHRVAVQCETARNYSSLQNNSSNLTNQNNPNSNSSNKKPPSGQDKLKALKQQGK